MEIISKFIQRLEECWIINIQIQTLIITKVE